MKKQLLLTLSLVTLVGLFNSASTMNKTITEEKVKELSLEELSLEEIDKDLKELTKSNELVNLIKIDGLLLKIFQFFDAETFGSFVIANKKIYNRFFPVGPKNKRAPLLLDKELAIPAITLQSSVRANNQHCVYYFLTKKNVFASVILNLAMQYKHDNIITLLIKEKAINKKIAGSFLIFEAKNNHTDNVFTLISNTAFIKLIIQEDAGNALHWPAHNGYMVVVFLLIKNKKFMKNITSEDADDALFWAAHNNHTLTVSTLLEKKAFMKHITKEGAQRAIDRANTNKMRNILKNHKRIKKLLNNDCFIQ